MYMELERLLMVVHSKGGRTGASAGVKGKPAGR
jgi:hypothetical protein